MRWGGRLWTTPLLALGATAITFGAAAPPANCPTVTVAGVQQAAGHTVDWIVDNQQPDGSFLYEYDRSTGRTELFGTGAYNIVRHAGVLLALYQAAGHDYEGALDSADRGLEWALGHAVERHGWVGITTEPYVQAGTNALMVAALAERREVTGDHQHDQLLAQLGTFLVGQVEDNGALLGYYDLDPDQPRPDRYSIYYTGEAWWALTRLHRAFPDGGWGAVANLVGHYLATERDHTENIWPPLADHWSGYGLGETAAFPDRPEGQPLTDDELAFARRQGGILGQRVRGISERFGPWGTFVRGTFEPRGGGYGVFGEGLGGLWRAAQADDRLADIRTPLGERQMCIVGLAIDALETPSEAAAYANPGFVSGAWFQNEVTRMDDQQHALSALFATIPILDSPQEVAGTNPMWVLWFVAVVGVLNPLRAIRRRPDNVAHAAAGAAGGAAILFTIGAFSGLLLDALNVSQPAIRLAAAGLCVFSAVVDLLFRDRESGDPKYWWVAYIVRPALVVAGWSVVADHGLVFYAAALVLAVATVPVVRLPDTPANWGMRLMSSLAIAASLLLVVHAVFDV